MNNELPNGWFSEQNIATYRRLVESLPEQGILIELGSWKGRSICSVADIILKKKLHVICVDTFKGTPGEEAHAEARAKGANLKKEMLFNLKMFGIHKRVTVLKATTHEAVAHCFNNMADMVFIDADHSYEAVKQDILDWKPKLRAGGIISGHDFTWESVHRAIADTLLGVENESTVWWKKL